MLEQIERIGWLNPPLPQAVTETRMEAKAALILASQPGNRVNKGDGVRVGLNLTNWLCGFHSPIPHWVTATNITLRRTVLRCFGFHLKDRRVTRCSSRSHGSVSPTPDHIRQRPPPAQPCPTHPLSALPFWACSCCHRDKAGCRCLFWDWLAPRDRCKAREINSGRNERNWLSKTLNLRWAMQTVKIWQQSLL